MHGILFHNMFYFIRTVILYMVIFVTTAYAVHKGAIHYFETEHGKALKPNPVVVRGGLPSILMEVRDTETGLMLAGMAAQNRRDWGQATQIFNRLNEKFDNNPDIALRAMTLALGNGEFDKAEAMAEMIYTSYLATEADNDISEKFDVAYLFLTLKSVKERYFERAKDMLDRISSGSLAEFAKPIVLSWIEAEEYKAQGNSDKSLVIATRGMSFNQQFFVALAYEYAGYSDKAKSLMKKLSRQAVLSSYTAIDIAGFCLRQEDKACATNAINEAFSQLPNSALLKQAKKALDAEQLEEMPLQDRSVAHLRGIASAVSMAFHDFSRVMIAEHATDGALLFARMAEYLDDDTSSVHRTIGDILAYQEQNDEAIKVFAKVKRDDPEFKQALARQIELMLLDDGQSLKAENILRSVIADEKFSNEDKAYFYYLFANVMKEDRQYPKALDAYDTAEILAREKTGVVPDEMKALYYSRGVVLDLMGRWDEAEKELRSAMVQIPDNPLILNYIGYGYADRDVHLDKAKEMISQAVLMAPNDPYIIDSMGWILYRMGDYQSAVKYLERAALLSPYHMVINDHLGDVYWKLGRKLEAHYMWQRAADYYEEDSEEQQRMIVDTRRKLREGL